MIGDERSAMLIGKVRGLKAARTLLLGLMALDKRAKDDIDWHLTRAISEARKELRRSSEVQP